MTHEAWEELDKAAKDALAPLWDLILARKSSLELSALRRVERILRTGVKAIAIVSVCRLKICAENLDNFALVNEVHTLLYAVDQQQLSTSEPPCESNVSNPAGTVDSGSPG